MLTNPHPPLKHTLAVLSVCLGYTCTLPRLAQYEGFHEGKAEGDEDDSGNEVLFYSLCQMKPPSRARRVSICALLRNIEIHNYSGDSVGKVDPFV